MLVFVELGDTLGGPSTPCKKHNSFTDTSMRFGQTGACWILSIETSYRVTAWMQSKELTPILVD